MNSRCYKKCSNGLILGQWWLFLARIVLHSVWPYPHQRQEQTMGWYKRFDCHIAQWWVPKHHYESPLYHWRVVRRNVSSFLSSLSPPLLTFRRRVVVSTTRLPPRCFKDIWQEDKKQQNKRSWLILMTRLLYGAVESNLYLLFVYNS